MASEWATIQKSCEHIMTDQDKTPDFTALLIQHRDQLLNIVRKRAAGIMRFESASDLVQGIHMQAIGVADKFEYQNDKAFLGWLLKLAEQHISNRHHYWNANKRKAQRMIELSGTGSAAESQADRPKIDPASPHTGPVSFAAREEEVEIALQAIAVLKERDQKLVQWMSEDLSTAEVAQRLDVAPDTAERARQRAIERFRKSYEILVRKRGES